MTLEIELQPRGEGDPTGSQVCPGTLKRFRTTPSHFFRANPVIIFFQVSSLTLNNLHYILSEMKKAARPAQVTSVTQKIVWYNFLSLKEKIEIFVME